MSPDLAALLACPATRQPLTLAPTELVAELEARRLAGTLHFAAAEPQFAFDQPIEAALLREDCGVCYVVQRGIPLLLPDHAVELRFEPDPRI